MEDYLERVYGEIIQEAELTKNPSMPLSIAIYALIGDRLERYIITKQEAATLMWETVKHESWRYR